MENLEWMLHQSVLYMQYQHMKSHGLNEAAATLHADAEARLNINLSQEMLQLLPLEAGIISKLARQHQPLLTLVSLGLKLLSENKQPEPGDAANMSEQFSLSVFYLQCEHLRSLGLESSYSILKLEVEKVMKAPLLPELLGGLPLSPELRANLEKEPHPLLTLVALGMRQLSMSSEEQPPITEESEILPDKPASTPAVRPPLTNTPSSKPKIPRAFLSIRRKKKFKDWTWKERIEAFYSEKAPEKLPDIAKLLRRYAGNEDELMAIMIVKYGESTYEKSHHFGDEVIGRLHAERQAHDEHTKLVAEARLNDTSGAAQAEIGDQEQEEKSESKVKKDVPAYDCENSDKVAADEFVESLKPPHPQSSHVDTLLQTLDKISLDALIQPPKPKLDRTKEITVEKHTTKVANSDSKALGQSRRRRGGNLLGSGMSKEKRSSLMGFIDQEQLVKINAIAAETGHLKNLGNYHEVSHREKVKHLMFVYEPRSSLVHKKFVKVSLLQKHRWPKGEMSNDDCRVTQKQISKNSDGSETEIEVKAYIAEKEDGKLSSQVLLSMSDRVVLDDVKVKEAEPLLQHGSQSLGIPQKVVPTNKFRSEEVVLAITPAAFLRTIVMSHKFVRLKEKAFEEEEEELQEEWIKFKFKTEGQRRAEREEAKKEQRRKKHTDDLPWRNFLETHQESCNEVIQLFFSLPLKFAPDISEVFERLLLYLDTHEEDAEDVLQILGDWFLFTLEHFTWYSRASLNLVLGEGRKLLKHVSRRLLLKDRVAEIKTCIQELDSKAKIDTSDGTDSFDGAIHSVAALNQMKKEIDTSSTSASFSSERFQSATTSEKMGSVNSNINGKDETRIKTRKLIATNIWDVQSVEIDWRPEEEKSGQEMKSDASEVFGAFSNAARANAGLAPKPRVRSDVNLLSNDHGNLFEVRREDGPLNGSYKFDPREVARQMTLTAHQLFMNIPIYELDTAAWGKGDRRKHLADSIFQFLDYFEALRDFVTASVLLRDSAQRRAARIEYFVEMMEECFELRNAQGAGQIISALNAKYPKELPETMDMCSQKAKDSIARMKDMFNITQSHKNYRRKMDDWISGTVLGETKYVGHGDGIIPYMPVHLMDLEFTQNPLGNADMHPDFPDLVNVEKIRLKYNLLNYIFKLQQRKYNLEPVRLVNIALNRRMMDYWARSEREQQVVRLRLRQLGQRAASQEGVDTSLREAQRRGNLTNIAAST